MTDHDDDGLSLLAVARLACRQIREGWRHWALISATCVAIGVGIGAARAPVSLVEATLFPVAAAASDLQGLLLVAGHGAGLRVVSKDGTLSVSLSGRDQEFTRLIAATQAIWRTQDLEKRQEAHQLAVQYQQSANTTLRAAEMQRMAAWQSLPLTWRNRTLQQQMDGVSGTFWRIDRAGTNGLTAEQVNALERTTSDWRAASVASRETMIAVTNTQHALTAESAVPFRVIGGPYVSQSSNHVRIFVGAIIGFATSCLLLAIAIWWREETATEDYTTDPSGSRQPPK